MFDKEKNLASARSTILLIFILTIVNIFSIAFAESYFLYSAYLPQLFISFAIYEDPSLLMPMVIASLVYIFPYLLCYIFSKKRKGWMAFAAILFLVDTLLFLVDFIALISMGDFYLIIDLIVHVLVLVALFSGIGAYPKKKKKKKRK